MATQDVPFGVNEQLGFTELLQVISLRGRTGHLTLTGDSGAAMLTFNGGRLTGGDLLPPVQALDLGALSPDARRAAQEADIQRVLIEALGWQAGRAAFEPLEGQPDRDDGFDVDRMLIRAVGTLDEWHSAGAALPSAGACLIWMESRPTITTATPLTNLQRSILPLCNGRLSLAEIARRLHAPDLDVLRSAHDLMQRRYVRANNEAGDSAHDVAIEAIVNKVAVELQVRTAAVAHLRQRDRQVQTLMGVVVDAVNAFQAVLQSADADNAVESQQWVRAAVHRLQAQYGALELVTLERDGIHVGDLLGAYSSLGGVARDDFYSEAVNGLYHLLLQLAVYVVEQRVRGRPAAERVRATIGALLLELESAMRVARPAAASSGLVALREKYFHFV